MSNGWSLTGNAVAATEFLGTTNAQPLSVRTSGVERLRVQPDGKVAVGHNAPRTQLHVLAGISTGLDFTSAGAITLFPPDGFAWFHIDNGPAGGRPIGRLRISHGVSPGSHELMTLVQNGNVGIGTGAPTDKLHVVGNIRANDLLITSDARLKTGIRPLRGARDRLERLRGVEFEWKDSDESTPGPGAGVVAQEVEAVAPELVRGDDSKSVDVGGMLGTLVEAFKELAAENAALKLRLDALERAAEA